MSLKLKLIKYAIYLFLLFSLLILITIFYFLTTLPDYSSLKDYKPDVMTRVHASNGHLVKEYSKEYRKLSNYHRWKCSPCFFKEEFKY